MLEHDINVSEDGVVTASWSDIKRVVKKTGLRSKKRRKIMKRWKRMLNSALRKFCR